MGSVRGVLLDVDGTLVDSNDAHARSWVKALAEHGFDVPFPRVRRLIGKGGDKLLPEVTGVDADSPKRKAVTQRRAEISPRFSKRQRRERSMRNRCRPCGSS